MRYSSSKEVCTTLGICRKTLHRWAEENKIETIRTEGGWRKYNLEKYLNNITGSRIKVCYCRVSSSDRKEDLERQVLYLKEKYPLHEVITDIGSGINFKRKGLLRIIKLAFDNLLEELVVTYKDRLCRIGYDLIFHILTTYSGTNIIVENKVDKTIAQEITEDLIEIITVYSSKIYGTRSYKNEKIT